jgi:hypothetical protein
MALEAAMAVLAQPDQHRRAALDAVALLRLFVRTIVFLSARPPPI